MNDELFSDYSPGRQEILMCLTAHSQYFSPVAIFAVYIVSDTSVLYKLTGGIIASKSNNYTASNKDRLFFRIFHIWFSGYLTCEI